MITISKAALTEAHLAAAGARLDTPIIGTDGGRVFSESVLNDKADIDFEACRQDLIAAGNEVRES